MFEGPKHDDGPGPCSWCGFVRVALPEWAKKPWAVFALDGRTWRIVATGSTNRGPGDGYHFRDYVIVEQLDGPKLRLPPEGSKVAALQDFLHSMNEAPKVYAEDLARALRVT